MSTISNLQYLVNGLQSSDSKQAYECLKQLENESKNSAAVYKFFDTFTEMLNSQNSFVRTRGIVLIAANSKWDQDNKIDEIIDRYLKHITDAKPITARQCIKVLPIIAKYKPELRREIESALCHANAEIYKESMRALVRSDIQKALSDTRNLLCPHKDL